MMRRAMTAEREGRAGKRARAADGIEAGDAAAFEALRAWRREEARRQSVPPYVIFADRTLADLARERPATLDALTRIGGVGQVKLARYGAAVLEVLRAEEPPLDRRSRP
jgi:ATP-dependent DNA helicase RecQ